MQVVRVLCLFFGYSRQAHYQQIKARQQEALQEDLLIQEVIRISSGQKRIGSRKLLVKLSPFMAAHNIHIGRDAFLKLLSERGLLVRKRRRSKPQTTFSSHWLRKYSNLAVGFVPRAAGQLWVFDITYIPLQESFASLSLITDAYSRKIVGFFLSADLAAIGCIRALGMALATWFQQDYLIHHSDMGLHYCSQGYIKLLKEKGNAISMTQSGDPLENALAERVNGILKEELLKKVYPTFQEAQLAVATAISIYNHQSPHLSINMLTPVQAHGREGDLKRHWKNYYTAIKEQQVPM